MRHTTNHLGSAEHWPISLPAYHLDRTADSHSSLEWLRDNPWSYYQGRVLGKPGIENFSWTPSKSLGTACHLLLFEPHDFHNRVITLSPGAGPTSKEAKIAKSDPLAIVLSDDQVALAYSIIERVKATPAAMRLLDQPGRMEHAVRFRVPGYDHTTYKACFDFIGDDGTICDLKVMADNSPKAFARSVNDYGYHRQAATYCLARDIYMGWDWRTWQHRHPKHHLITVCSGRDQAHECSVYTLSPRAIAMGYEQNAELMEQLDDMRSGFGSEANWHRPGYLEPVTLDLPEYAYRQESGA
jgi:hypothetical protein